MELQPTLGLLSAALLVVSTAACDPTGMSEDLALDGNRLLGALTGDTGEEPAAPSEENDAAGDGEEAPDADGQIQGQEGEGGDVPDAGEECEHFEVVHEDGTTELIEICDDVWSHPCEDIEQTIVDGLDPALLAEVEACYDQQEPYPVEDPCDELHLALEQAESDDEVDALIEELEACYEQYDAAFEDSCQPLVDAMLETIDPALLEELELCYEQEQWDEPHPEDPYIGDPCEDLIIAFEETGDEFFLDEYEYCIGDGHFEDPCEDLAIAFEQSIDPQLLDAVHACYENAEPIEPLPVPEDDPCAPIWADLEALEEDEQVDDETLDQLLEALEACYEEAEGNHGGHEDGDAGDPGSDDGAFDEPIYEDPCAAEVEAALASADQDLLAELEGCYEDAYPEPEPFDPEEECDEPLDDEPLEGEGEDDEGHAGPDAP